MSLSDRAIELPRLVILTSVLACAMGFIALVSLPKERTPRVKLPVILVAVVNPGASPSDNEDEIVRKIEKNVGELKGLRSDGGVRSLAANGAAIIQFVFDDSQDVDEAKSDVTDLIDRIEGEFPPQAQTDPAPSVNDIAFEDFPVIQVVIAGGGPGGGDGGGAVLRREVAEELQDRIEEVQGIARVDLFGGLEEEVQVSVNADVMTLRGFWYDKIASAIRAANTPAPTGELRSAGGEQRVRTQSKLEDLESIRDLPIDRAGSGGGQPILLGDIASVEMGSKDPLSVARYGGEDAVVLLARAETDIDVLGAADKVQELVDAFVADGSNRGTDVGTVRSQAREIRYMMSQLGGSAFYGTILIIIILWIFMGWRNALLISIALPFSILLTAGLMWVCKHTFLPDIAINNMTMFAMILVVGLVVDGCIIVGENIYRHRELGRPPVDAAKLGVHEVGTSLLSAYLTTFAAFGPMFLVSGIMGDFLSLLPTTVIFALIAAMLVDHFLLPVLSMYVMRVKRAAVNATPEELDARREMSNEEEEIANMAMVTRSSRIKRVYGRMLGYALQHRGLVLGLSLSVATMPAVLFWMGAIRFEFFPKSDIPIVEVNFELPLGSAMQRTAAGDAGAVYAGATQPADADGVGGMRAVRAMTSEEVAAALEAAVVRAVRPDEWYRPSEGSPRVRPVTTIGEPGALNINLSGDEGQGPEFGLIYVELELASDRDRSVYEIRDAIVEELPRLPGVEARVNVPAEGPPTGSPVAIRLLGREDTDMATLRSRAQEVERILKRLPGTYDVTSDDRLRPEVHVTPNDAVANLFNITRTGINNAVNYALEGVKLGEVTFGTDNEIDLRLRNLPSGRDQIDDLENLPLRAPNGGVVDLGQVARVERVRDANVIRHYDTDRVITVRSQLHDGFIADDVKAELIATLRPELTAAQQHTLLTDRGNATVYSDPYVRIEFGGENEERDKALEDLNLALVVGAAAMMIILTVKFNSFIQPLIVLLSVPLSLVGVSMGLMIAGFNFSISAMIGVVALSGIVVNDAIVLVDFINRMKAAGIPTDQAVIAAGQLRIRPIFLTTATTVGGLVPLALNLSGGGEFWQPLTLSIMCGLAFATLLQLFVIPIAYYTLVSDTKKSWLDPLSHPRLAKGLAALTTTTTAPPEPAPPPPPQPPPQRERERDERGRFIKRDAIED